MYVPIGQIVTLDADKVRVPDVGSPRSSATGRSGFTWPAIPRAAALPLAPTDLSDRRPRRPPGFLALLHLAWFAAVPSQDSKDLLEAEPVWRRFVETAESHSQIASA